MDYYNEKIVAKMLVEIIQKMFSDPQFLQNQQSRTDPGIAGQFHAEPDRSISSGSEMERSEASDSFRCGSPSGERSDK